MPREWLIQHRAGTLAEWAAAEASGPVLLAGERAYITDLKLDVVGDGVTKVASLGAVGSGTYAAKLKALRATAMAAAGRAGMGSISTLTPTITVTSGTSTTTIAGGKRVTPRRLSDLLADPIGDPHFRWIEAVPGKLPLVGGDFAWGDFLTGGASAARRWNAQPEFIHDGQVFEIYMRAISTSTRYRLWVDGHPLTDDATSFATTNPSYQLIKVDFGSIASRRIRIEMVQLQFGGIFIEPTGSIRRSDAGAPVFVAFGDSITAGANGVDALDTWPRHTARMLGAEWVNLAIGGSKFGDGSTASDFRNRIGDIVAANPDVLLFYGGANDPVGGAVFNAEVSYVFGQIKAQIPNALVFVAGIHVGGTAVDYVEGRSREAGLRAAATANGWPFISMLDPGNLYASTTAWAATTLYWPGAYVTYGGWVQRCTTYHTSTGSFDATKFRPTTLVHGSGKEGTTTADGTADVYIQSDGIHMTARGHKALGAHFASQVLGSIR